TPLGVLGEVPGPAAAEPQEFVVPLADYRHGGFRRQGGPDNLPDAPHQLRVARVGAAAVRLPAGAPLLLPAPPAAVEQLPVPPLRREAADRRLAEVVYEHILGADHAVARRADTHGVVVVLEQADLEPLVQRPDAVKHLTAHRRAEHGRHWDVEVAASE